MKLYYSPGACSLSVLIVINELHLPVDLEKVDLKTKQTETGKDFFTINPKGAVGTVELDNGEILTENAAIMQYLADHTKGGVMLLPLISDFKRYRVLEWLNYISTEVHKGFGPLFNASLDPKIKEKFIPNLAAKFTFLDKHLQTHEYLTGNQFTLPDAYLFVMLTWAQKLNLPIEDLEHLRRYYQMIHERPAVVRAFEQENL